VFRGATETPLNGSFSTRGPCMASCWPRSTEGSACLLLPQFNGSLEAGTRVTLYAARFPKTTADSEPPAISRPGCVSVPRIAVMRCNIGWNHQTPTHHAHTTTHNRNPHRRHRRLRGAKEADRHSDCRDPADAGWEPSRTSRHAPTHKAQTKDERRRPETNRSGATEEVGGGKRRVGGVTPSPAPSPKAKTETQRRWPEENHRGHQKALGRG
jgi:hypothetical protein